MAEGTGSVASASAPPDLQRLHEAAREARDDAAPFALAAAAILIALALVARHAHWQSLGNSLWWMWAVIAVPYLCLAAMLLLGLNRLVRQDRRREIVIGLLALVWVFTVLGVIVLVASLVAHSAVQATGRQLLFSGGAVWFTDAVAFGLGFWELDRGARCRAHSRPERANPIFSYPRTRTRNSPAKVGGLDWDYFYVSLTNATAFSATDVMPLTRPAKALMAAESTLSAVTVLLVAARAVNILA